MKSTSLKIKILSGMLCTGLAFSGANLTFVAVKNNDNVNDKIVSSMDLKAPIYDKKNAKARHAEMKVTLETVVKESVASKIITKTEGDKVLEYVNAKSSENRWNHRKDKKCKKGKCDGARGGLFRELVTEGILTQEKSDALKERMYVKKTEIRTLELKKGLDTLVVKKVLTIDQSDKVKVAMIARETGKKEMYKKMKNMSEKERIAYMEKTKRTVVDPIKVLIDNGTITKEQEIEIQKVLPHYNYGAHSHR